VTVATIERLGLDPAELLADVGKTDASPAEDQDE